MWRICWQNTCKAECAVAAGHSRRDGMVDPGETQQIIRIVIAEDNDDLRALLPPLLNDTADLRCLATTAQIGEAASLIAKHHADVAILDIQLRDGSALKHLPDLSKQFPATKFLIHSG